MQALSKLKTGDGEEGCAVLAKHCRAELGIEAMFISDGVNLEEDEEEETETVRRADEAARQVEKAQQEQIASKTATVKKAGKKGAKKVENVTGTKEGTRRDDLPPPLVTQQSVKVTVVPEPVKLTKREARKVKADLKEQLEREQAEAEARENREKPQAEARENREKPQPVAVADTSTKAGGANGSAKKIVKGSTVKVDDDAGKWHCQQCTLLNDAFRGWCEVTLHTQIPYPSHPSSTFKPIHSHTLPLSSFVLL
jgi:hypothetical protein